MINWNKYFDKIYVLSYVKNFDRRKIIESEFKRIGITDYEFYLNIDDNFLIESNIYSKSQTNAAHGHYSIIKKSYELGYNRIAIVEDDVIFLKDLNEISKCLENYYKEESDIYLFTGAIENYFDDDSKFYVCSQLYSINRYGMEYLIYMHETYHYNADQYFFNENTLHKYPSLGILFGDSQILISMNIPDKFLDIKCKKYTDVNPICIEYSQSEPVNIFYSYKNIINEEQLELYNIKEYYE